MSKKRSRLPAKYPGFTSDAVPRLKILELLGINVDAPSNPKIAQTQEGMIDRALAGGQYRIEHDPDFDGLVLKVAVKRNPLSTCMAR